MQATFLIVILTLVSLNFYLVSKSGGQNYQQPSVDVTTQLDISQKSKTAQQVDVVTDVNVIPKVNIVSPVELVLKVDVVPQMQNAPGSGGLSLQSTNNNYNQQFSPLDGYRISSKKINLKTIPNEVLRLRKIEENNGISFFSWQGNQDEGQDNILKYLIDVNFEAEVRQLFNEVLDQREKGIMLDIGANAGYYGLMAVYMCIYHHINTFAGSVWPRSPCVRTSTTLQIVDLSFSSNQRI